MKHEIGNFKWFLRILIIKILCWYNKIPIKRFHTFFNLKKSNHKINIGLYIDYENIVFNSCLNEKDILILEFFNKLLRFNKFFEIIIYIIIDDQMYKIINKNKNIIDLLFRNSFESKIDRYIKSNYVYTTNSSFLQNNPIFNYRKDYDPAFIELVRDYLHAHDMRCCKCDFLVDKDNRFKVIKYHFDKLIK
jgi:hypothetical protein